MTHAGEQPPIRMRLDGFEDLVEVVSRLRATGARRESSRVFVVDRSLSAEQTAALLDFIAYGRSEGFLRVEVNAPEPDEAPDEELEAWWFGTVR
ncbi:hypothetical protein ACIP88_33430 [Streptomyces uncialis]|uniref:hypothetical protein n=1 Tax=Streptomyces uncialis TaxID=1048205 RepID=UPI0037FC0162